MSIHNTFEGAQFIAQTAEIAKETGISLRIGTCFAEYGNLVSTHLPEHLVGQPFDHRRNNFTAESGFWIAGWNTKGVLVHKQAVRRIGMSGRTLAEYMAQNYTNFLPKDFDLDRVKSSYNPGPAARRIKGKVCYHGDLWLSSDYRGTGLVNVLARFSLATALLRWKPDYVMGFMERPLAFKGLAEREGYMHSEPGAMYLHRNHIDQVMEGFMVWMAREDINHLLTIPLAGLVSLPVQTQHKVAA